MFVGIDRYDNGLTLETTNKELEKTKQIYDQMKEAQQLTQKSSDEILQQYQSAAVEVQKFDKTNVVHQIQQYSNSLASETKLSLLGEQMKSASTKGALDKTIEEFMKKRNEHNKMLIMKAKLSGAQKLQESML